MSNGSEHIPERGARASIRHSGKAGSMEIIRDRCPRCNWLNIRRADDASPFVCLNASCDADFERLHPTPESKEFALRDATELLIQAIIRPNTEGHVVYYIRWADRIKIGTTGNLEKRLRQLPYDEVLATEPGSTGRERERHSQFAHLLVAGQREWFHDAPELRAHVATLLDGAG